jgi:hypothetical protein
MYISQPIMFCIPKIHLSTTISDHSHESTEDKGNGLGAYSPGPEEFYEDNGNLKVVYTKYSIYSCFCCW